MRGTSTKLAEVRRNVPDRPDSVKMTFQELAKCSWLRQKVRETAINLLPSATGLRRVTQGWRRRSLPGVGRGTPNGQRREGFPRDHAHKATSTLLAPSPPRATWISEGACCRGQGWGEGATSPAQAPSPRPSPPQWSLFRKPHRVWGRGGRTLGNALWKSFTALPEGVDDSNCRSVATITR